MLPFSPYPSGHQILQDIINDVHHLGNLLGQLQVYISQVESVLSSLQHTQFGPENIDLDRLDRALDEHRAKQYQEAVKTDEPASSWGNP